MSGSSSSHGDQVCQRWKSSMYPWTSAGGAAMVSLRVTSNSAMAGSCHSAGAVRARADDPAPGRRQRHDANAIAPARQPAQIDARAEATAGDRLRAPPVDEDRRAAQVAAPRLAQADDEGAPA